MEISAPELRASMKALVPDLAMVPKLLTNSYLDIPIPVSQMVKVFSPLLGTILILKLGSTSNLAPSGSVMDLYLILSRASEALEISSLKKTSLLE
jgi:hypothetical protein